MVRFASMVTDRLNDTVLLVTALWRTIGNADSVYSTGLTAAFSGNTNTATQAKTWCEKKNMQNLAIRPIYRLVTMSQSADIWNCVYTRLDFGRRVRMKTRLKNLFVFLQNIIVVSGFWTERETCWFYNDVVWFLCFCFSLLVSKNSTRRIFTRSTIFR